MTISKCSVIATMMAMFVAGTGPAAAMGPAPLQTPSLTSPAQFRFDFSDDDDPYSGNRHYDWNQYRNSTSRKERIRDYYRMQQDMQKDYWRNQKEMQKQMIKRQRGW
ncbi:hypothetical protein AB4072_11685 [Microvirga sp. 2MCAF38]|uniref:hypothetical protein n=1 Tax=Microvirga sp. 2MCAF38 TaxID=3232989 RepID=UPI003F94B3CB